MSWVCYFVPIKRFSRCKLCILMWFVPLRTFLPVRFWSRNGRVEWGGFGLVSDVRDWHLQGCWSCSIDIDFNLLIRRLEVVVWCWITIEVREM